jgi:hypothetical protein
MLAVAPSFRVSQGRAVGIVTGYKMDDRKVRSSKPGKVRILLFFTMSRPVMGQIQPHIQ